MLYLDDWGVKQDLTKAHGYLRLSAEAGYPLAQHELGLCYEKGEGVIFDKEASLSWFVKSMEGLREMADDGDPMAKNHLGWLLYEGQTRGVKQDSKRAIQLLDQAVSGLEKLAEQGFSGAQFELAEYYYQAHLIARSAGLDREKVETEVVLKMYQKSAEHGSSRALCRLAEIFWNKQNENLNYVKAADYCRQAIDRCSALAKVLMGLMYFNGVGVSQDTAKAREYFKQEAQRGNSEAIIHLGYMHKHGVAVEKDIFKAIEYFERAAKQGEEKAMCILAEIYLHGDGVEKNTMRGLDYYEQAVKKNFVPAMLDLGGLYYEGVGVSARDIIKSREYFKRAADSKNINGLYYLGLTYNIETELSSTLKSLEEANKGGHMGATTVLGFIYYEGIGVDKNEIKAAGLLKKAMKEGMVWARLLLALMHAEGSGVEKDYRLAADLFIRNKAHLLDSYADDVDYRRKGVYYTWLSERADNESLVAMYIMARAYWEGSWGLKKDHKKAIDWFLRASEGGHGMSTYSLGLIYSKGMGVEQDLDRAIEYFTLASERHNALAMVQLAAMHEKGVGVQVSRDNAIEWYRRALNEGFSPAESVLTRLGHTE